MSVEVEFVDLTDESHTPLPLPIKKTREEMKQMAGNIITLVQSSNACPFVQSYQLYRCFYCQEKFPDMAALREHSERDHAFPNVKASLDPLHKGTYVMVDITNLRCRFCNEPTPTISILRSHIASVHNTPTHPGAPDGLIPFILDLDTFNCLICGANFTLFQLLSQHMNVHYGDKVCETCGAGFLSHGRLKSHRMIHKEKGEETGDFYCPDCTKVFPTERSRRAHIERIHEQKARYRCPKCPETFTEYYIRVTHLYNVHDVDPPEHKCEHCGSTYRTKANLKKHTEKCTVINPLEDTCPYCDVYFRTYRSLKKHKLNCRMVGSSKNVDDGQNSKK